MAHLAELQPVVRVVDEEIPDIASVGGMAGDAGHLPAAPLFGRILFALQGMPLAGGCPDHMGLGGDMAVA